MYRDHRLCDVTLPCVLYMSIILAVGEHGVAVTITRDKLSPSQQEQYDAAWQANAFNGYANDLMSLHRSLQDTRDAEYVKLVPCHN